mgnify:FL=1
MTLTAGETLITILMVALGTVITRFLPFFLFANSQDRHPYVSYLGKVLPYATIGLLVVYCLQNVSFTKPPFGIPELVATAAIVLLHYWRDNALLSIGVGTAIYMFLVQRVF